MCLFDGNHPVNYKGCTKENISTSPFEKIHSSHTNQTITAHSMKSYICSNKQTKFFRSNKYKARATSKPMPSITSDVQELKNMMKSLSEQMGTMLNLLITVLNRI
jgi:hypothetical protein